MDHYQFVFNSSPETTDMLIAMLDNIGFEGFEEDELQLKAFIPVEKFEEDLFDNFIKEKNIVYSKSVIKETNWNEKWESGFEPVIVNHPVSKQGFASVRANFHAPVYGVIYDLIITPKMSFGTGHHATTFLMIQQMSQLDFKDKEVIDFGTGTGVLAILAEKLGAIGITGIDNDDWSINNAKENIEANACTQVNLLKAETIPSGIGADIILANINLNIIITNLDAIRSACNPGASVLFSGIMLQDESQIMEAIKTKGFVIKAHSVKDNWLVILAESHK
jgi:ribosomal protein L11 methyltransferase